MYTYSQNQDYILYHSQGFQRNVVTVNHNQDCTLKYTTVKMRQKTENPKISCSASMFSDHLN